VPAEPKTTFNVGVIEGGRSINTIASSASMLLDLRSEAPDALARLVERVLALVEGQRAVANNGRSPVTIDMEQIGNRPAGQISRQAPLVGWVTIHSP
jgi:tripeptide aminopeptidase